MTKKWNWLISGVMLGMAFLLAVLLMKPIGVSTQFVILDGIAWNAIDSDLIVKTEKDGKSVYTSKNEYLNKSNGKYAKNIENPLNYSFVFVISMILGGFISKKTLKNKLSLSDTIAPKVWIDAMGSSPKKRYIYTFIAGFLVLIGARLAGGCASGHMISGMMQTSLSGYLFAFASFSVGIPVAILIFKSK